MSQSRVDIMGWWLVAICRTIISDFLGQNRSIVGTLLTYALNRYMSSCDWVIALYIAAASLEVFCGGQRYVWYSVCWKMCIILGELRMETQA